MTTPLTFLGIAGSLRAGSLNRATLRAAKDLVPDDVRLDLYEGLGALPHYDGDLDNTDLLPDAVRQLKKVIAAADALVLVTPEYNYSVPGVLKNALDWASRPTGEQPAPLRGKPVAILSASPGNFGGVRAQMHLRQICLGTDMLPLNRPEILISRARERFDASGTLTDEPTLALIRDQMHALAAWTRTLQRKE